MGLNPILDQKTEKKLLNTLL